MYNNVIFQQVVIVFLLGSLNLHFETYTRIFTPTLSIEDVAVLGKTEIFIRQTKFQF